MQKRTRMAPDDRRHSILDAAARLVTSIGVRPITMDRVAQEAGVSKGLVYAYFDNLTSLLCEVLQREHKRLAREQLDTVAAAESFEAMARGTAHNNFERDRSRGMLVKRLRNEPAIAAAMQATERRNREAVIAFLSDAVTSNFAIPADVARLATGMIIGEGESGDTHSDADIARMDEIWGAMMVGAMKELERRCRNQGAGND